MSSTYNNRRPGKPAPGSGALKIFGAVGLVALLWAGGGWGLMLTVGIVHGWWPTVPTMPYTVALAVAAVRVVVALVGGALQQVVKGAFR